MVMEMKKTRVKMTKPLYLRMSILVQYDYFGVIILAQNMETKQNYAMILIALLFTLKPKIFLKIFLMMLKKCLIRLIMIKMIKDLFQQV